MMNIHSMQSQETYTNNQRSKYIISVACLQLECKQATLIIIIS